MNDDAMIRARRTPGGGLKQILPDGTTRPLEVDSDRTRFDAITDEEAYQNALDDPDNPPLTPERLAKTRRVPKPEQLRLKMGLTQEEFARRFEISLSTLRDWEQGLRHLDRTAVSYLSVIEKIPKVVAEALNAEPSDRELTEAPRRRAG